jgi:glucose-1-phosphate thymidylyltransferase
MKGVILAGGSGSRLLPLTKVTNKHLLAVGNVPMLFHPLRKLVQAGIKEIMVVTGTDHVGPILRLLGTGDRVGELLGLGKEVTCEFTYKVQEGALGIAHALNLARTFSGGEPLLVILGDNIFEDDLTPYKEAFLRQGAGAKLLLKKVTDAGRFGVAELSGDRIIGIEEKPARPKSDMAVTGIYFYDARIFEAIGTLRMSARGELEITDVNNWYIRKGQLTHGLLKGYWTDAGTFESLRHAQRLVSGEER